LTRASIFFGKLFSKVIDCRVKPGNDARQYDRRSLSIRL
jgi:hypothetical protein